MSRKPGGDTELSDSLHQAAFVTALWLWRRDRSSVLYLNWHVWGCSAPIHPCGSNAVAPSSHTQTELDWEWK